VNLVLSASEQAVKMQICFRPVRKSKGVVLDDVILKGSDLLTNLTGIPSLCFLSRQRKNKGMGVEKRGILLFRF
jgi:hypothetical protein